MVVAAVVREAGSYDVGLLNGGSIRIDDVIPAGPMTEYDAIRMLPFGGKVVSVSLDGAALAERAGGGRREPRHRRLLARVWRTAHEHRLDRGR